LWRTIGGLGSINAAALVRTTTNFEAGCHFMGVMRRFAKSPSLTFPSTDLSCIDRVAHAFGPPEWAI